MAENFRLSLSLGGWIMPKPSNSPNRSYENAIALLDTTSMGDRDRTQHSAINEKFTQS
ncbi:hypothetical protein H6G28_35395 [Nostoc sp. FACHB-190]|nr:hypothetical protein [Nostoc sp. FACHB-190]MBD2303774.1 hypothetical protein [Nostoc sp. FACHB-190]